MERVETDEYIERVFDDFNGLRSDLSLKLRNDKDGSKERIINQKLNHVDGVIKHLLKFRSLLHRERGV